MKPETLIFSAVFAALCTAANWHYTSVQEKMSQTITVNLDGAQIVIVICAIILFFAIRSIYQSLRLCLDQGIRIPKQVRFINWAPCLFLVPMFISWSYSSSEPTPDGGLLRYSYGYGSPATGYAMVVVVLTILCYQVAAGFFQYRRMANRETAAG